MEVLIQLGWPILKAILAILIGYATLIIALHVRALRRLSFYEKQGHTLYPGCKNFFFGNMLDLVEY